MGASLANKLPFGNKSKKKEESKKDNIAAALNASLAKKNESHKDNVKGAISGLLASKQAISGQGSIGSDTTSLLGIVDTMAKYNKMKKVGMPMTSIKNKMKLDGFNDIQIAKFAGEKVPYLNGIDLDIHNLTKYSKMKKFK